MCSLKKNCIIFNVSQHAQHPILIINQKDFTGEDCDNMVPLIGVYNGTHYESLYPATEKDEELTVEFVKHFPGFQGNFKNFIKGIANDMDIVNTFNIQTLSDSDELSGTAQKISEILVIDGKNSSDALSEKTAEQLSDKTEEIFKIKESYGTNSIVELSDNIADESDTLQQTAANISNILSDKTQEIFELDGSEITKISDNFCVNGSEVTNSSDNLSQETEEISAIDARKVTNRSEMLSNKTQKISEKDGSDVTNSTDNLSDQTKADNSTHGATQGTKKVYTSETNSKKGGQNKPIFKDRPLNTKVSGFFLYS
jgi:hypothetical protein